MSVRTRIAPSPTGDPHVGTAFVALINYAFARKAGGAFVLRIEDTDLARSTAASERAILAALRWLGLSWDEGPDIGGAYGPYRQSERSERYARAAEELLARGHAFRCWCTPQRLEAMRAEQRKSGAPTRYDGHCLQLAPAERAGLQAAGAPSVVRLVVPESGGTIVDDVLHGPIHFEWRDVDMQVLLKSDGLPTYHLANVVDDHEMAISHVFRGEEWISSAPKHQLLYRYFGWEMPVLGHTPLLRNLDRSKLSKRKNPTGILFFERMGYLPEALLNFLGNLANAPEEGRELESLAEFVARFELQRIATQGPVFDLAKLDWLNGRYLRERLDAEELVGRIRAWAFDPGYVRAVAALAQSRIARLSDLAPLCGFFFAGRLEPPLEELRAGKLGEAAIRKAFVLALALFEGLGRWEVDAIDGAMRRVAAAVGAKLRDATRPFYVAITGSAQSVPLFDAIALLGRDLVRERLRVALARLGGATNAERESWLRELEALAANGSAA
ncbi:MAG: glutamate--tRNA ligase [Vulcanimicrobiaceae bacterium]